MGAVFAIVFPIYCVIALGYCLVRFGVFASSDMKIIGRFVLGVAFPALIFDAVTSRALGEVFNPDYMLAYVLSGLAMIAVSYVMFSVQNQSPHSRAVNVMGACCPNNGFVGYAVFLLALPDLAGVILTLNILVENLVIVPICLLILHGAGRNGRGIKHIGKIFLDVLKLPMIIGLLAGTFVALVGLEIPTPFSKGISLIASTASGLGLIVIGGSLVDLPSESKLAQVWQPVFGKLLVNPAIAGLVVAALLTLGVVELDPSFYAAVILSSAMPSFVILVMFAQRYELQAQASLILLGTTVGACLTLSLLLGLLL